MIYAVSKNVFVVETTILWKNLFIVLFMELRPIQ
jgi:hypothetical protein